MQVLLYIIFVKKINCQAGIQREKRHKGPTLSRDKCHIVLKKDYYAATAICLSDVTLVTAISSG